MSLKTNTERSPLYSQETQPTLKPAEQLAASPLFIRDMAYKNVLQSEAYRARHSRQDSAGIRDFSEAAAELAEGDGINDPFERSLLSVVSKLGTAIDAKMEIDELREKRSVANYYDEAFNASDKDRMYDLKIDYLIPFNDTVKELLNDYPHMTVTDLTKNLGVAYASIYGQYNSLHPDKPRPPERHQSLDATLFDLETTINGMRHELAAETLLSAAGVEYSYDTTVEDDANGHDMFVRVDGEWKGVDIKASLTAERRSHNKSPYSRAVWTGLIDSDFRGVNGTTPDAVSIPYDLAKQHGGEFAKWVKEAATGELNRKYRHQKRVGSRALQYHH